MEAHRDGVAASVSVIRQANGQRNLAYFNGLVPVASELLAESMALVPDQPAVLWLQARLRDWPPPGPR
jgi:hypothetical protein